MVQFTHRSYSVRTIKGNWEMKIYNWMEIGLLAVMSTFAVIVVGEFVYCNVMLLFVGSGQ